MAKYTTGCCGEQLESKFRHDFVRCKCGRSFVDGGDAYSRRGWTEPDEPPRPVEQDRKDSCNEQQ